MTTQQERTTTRIRIPAKWVLLALVISLLIKEKPLHTRQSAEASAAHH